MWLVLSGAESALASSALAAAFVGSLYVWKQSDKSRDHPHVIQQRMLSVTLVTVLSPFVLLAFDRPATAPASVSVTGPTPAWSVWFGVPPGGYAAALTLPLLLTVILFAGPLVMLAYPHDVLSDSQAERERLTASSATSPPDAATASTPSPAPAPPAPRVTRIWCVGGRAKVNELQRMWACEGDESFAPPPVTPALALRHHNNHWMVIRNLLIAPVAEEVVFRGVVCALLIAGGWGFGATVFGSPLLFGVAHLHHLIGLVRQRGYGLAQAAVAVTFQLFYTTVFGAFAGFLFLRTGHVLAPVLSHAFCNSMGFPDLKVFGARDPALRWTAITSHVLGLATFALLLFPLTEPALYGGSLFAQFF